jgi:hypothetical protein
LQYRASSSRHASWYRGCLGLLTWERCPTECDFSLLRLKGLPYSVSQRD